MRIKAVNKNIRCNKLDICMGNGNSIFVECIPYNILHE